MQRKIIGRGTWLDKVADKVIKRSHKLGKSSSTIKTESGIGASGVPHIGSFADAARAYGVKLAVEDRGYTSEYIAFSDDKDGLRKVPDGFPPSLSKYIAFPVSSIPDPFKCHESYGSHMGSLLLDALDQIGIEYTFISASKAYQQGIFKDEIVKILDCSEKIGELIQQEISQQKYLETLPYFPICQNCGRIYTTRAHRWHRSEGKIQYICESIRLRDQTIPGCGFEGEVDYRSGEGKLSWKVEFAVRWSALNIDFEAYGKDIADSVRVNDVIMRKVLHKEPPHHIQYEMFLDKSGRKISKSIGNVFTPQVWLRYGSPESLMLLMYKRIVGTRELSIEDIPKYMDELDDLENIYFEKKRIKDEMERAKLKGLYEYCTLLKPPCSAHTHVPYATLLELAKVAPPGKERAFILDKLAQYDISYDRDPEGINKRIRYTLNWITDFREEERKDVTFNEVEKEALEELIKGLKDATDETAIQNLIFSIAKSHNIPIKNFFQLIYMILLNKLSGPKLSSYILSMGNETAIEKLRSSLN